MSGASPVSCLFLSNTYSARSWVEQIHAQSPRLSGVEFKLHEGGLSRPASNVEELSFRIIKYRTVVRHAFGNKKLIECQPSIPQPHRVSSSIIVVQKELNSMSVWTSRPNQPNDGKNAGHTEDVPKAVWVGMFPLKGADI